MHLPRVRFTVGTLLLAVVVVAANCWAFRHFLTVPMYGTGPVMHRTLPAGVGALPLVNVALIGIWSFMAMRLRSPRRGRAANLRPSPPGITYFSLHFLGLGGLFCLFVPGAIPGAREFLDPASDYAAGVWGAFIGEPGETVPWLILDSLVLGVLVSGPPLLCAWIGQMLATRCASTLPLRRFRMLTCLVSLGFASTGLAICLTPHPFQEEQEISIDFQVVDAATGRPISRAFVCIADPFPYDPVPPPPRAFTNDDGRVTLTGRFDVHGDRNAFATMGDFSPWGRWLDVSAEGHGTYHLPLGDVVGAFPDPVRPGLRRITLAPGEAPADDFRDIAGDYSDGRQGFGSSGIEITPDGRFAWYASGCTYRHEEYGRLRRQGRIIEFVTVPHPGRDIDVELTVAHRAIAWGDRLYLTPMDQSGLREFCRAALAPERPSHRALLASEHPSGYPYIPGSYLREMGRAAPRTGLPDLPPGAWAKFLVGELNLDDEEGSLRLAINSLMPRNSRGAKPPRTRQPEEALP